MDDIKEIVIVWENRVVFKMVKKEDWVIVVNETIKKPKKKIGLRNTWMQLFQLN